jgi:hypothetical protein
MPFADLDPHQKSILSDDFGVAVSTQWLYDSFGGFADIVHGREFMLQFRHLLRRRQRPSKAKVGPNKAPDFVLKDLNGKWHVLECKGTQSGRGTRNSFLRTALSQKQVIQISGRMRGERLAAGLSISNENDRRSTQLRIVDPDVEPLIALGDSQAEEADYYARRLAVARAFGMVGLDAIATELTLPDDVALAAEFLRPSEVSRIRISKTDRQEEAVQQLRQRRLQRLRGRAKGFEGRSIRFMIPEGGQATPFNRITVRQGINSELLHELSSPGSALSTVDSRVGKYATNARVNLKTVGKRISLTYGDILFSEVAFDQV